MSNEAPKVSPTGRYSVKETCSHLQIHRHTLAKYVQLGLIKEGRSLRNGRPFYTGSEILKLYNR